jgi:hypothetical protein
MAVDRAARVREGVLSYTKPPKNLTPPSQRGPAKKSA